ncbi:MAG: Fic family protein [Proteobacteria bacterium]|nr:Fic family protein [Pseudomonadota bacterium]
MIYIHQQPNWPNFKWKDELIQTKLDRVRYLQGWLLGTVESIGFDSAQEALFTNITEDVINTSAIEGEILAVDQVRSSIAKKLGINIAGFVASERSVEGIVNVLLDATLNYDQELSKELLFKWHNELFPSGYSGFSKIIVAQWRLDKNGPMQVVSGPIGRGKVHFQAPDAKLLSQEMDKFITWFNQENYLNPILKAAITGFWFVTIHPFEDGNGRIARALTDMLLARAEMKKQRFYSMSTEIKERRKSYYGILEKTQKGSMDITDWLLWFLDCLESSIHKSKIILEKTLKKADFWRSVHLIVLNERQIKILNLLLDSFDGALTSTKWAKINKCSQDTAYRDICDLIEKGILEKSTSAGRSTHYRLTGFSDNI